MSSGPQLSLGVILALTPCTAWQFIFNEALLLTLSEDGPSLDWVDWCEESHVCGMASARQRNSSNPVGMLLRNRFQAARHAERDMIPALHYAV